MPDSRSLRFVREQVAGWFVSRYSQLLRSTYGNERIAVLLAASLGSTEIASLSCKRFIGYNSKRNGWITFSTSQETVFNKRPYEPLRCTEPCRSLWRVSQSQKKKKNDIAPERWRIQRSVIFDGDIRDTGNAEVLWLIRKKKKKSVIWWHRW